MTGRSFIIGLLFLAVYAASLVGEPGLETRSMPRAAATSGKQTYTQFCASCHGADARGDGPAAAALRTAPPDLTTLAKRHGGQFPYGYVSEVLRFGTRFTSHGSSDMPIWGPIFGSMESYDELAVQKRIKDLCEYLAALQQKES